MAARRCCEAGRCYKRSFLRMLPGADDGLARRVLSDLSACEAGLQREEMVRITRTLARSELTALASGCLREMERRDMRPSVRAHNAVLASYARSRKFGLSTQLLVRMRMLALPPDTESLRSVVHSAMGVPGGHKLAEVLRPELDRARGVVPAREHGGDARAHAGAARALELTAEESDTLLGVLSSSARATGEGSAIQLLQSRLAGGAAVSARSFLAVLGGYAKRSDRWREALQAVGMLEGWLARQKERARDALASRAYAAAISACDKAGQPRHAFELLGRMAEHGVPYSIEAFNTALLACRSLTSKDGDDGFAMAHKLLRQLRMEGLKPDSYTYNALLGVLCSRGGMGEQAFALLEQMHSEQQPASVYTYTAVIRACFPTISESNALKAAVASSKVALEGVDQCGTANIAQPATPWRRALTLLSEMKLRGVPPNQHTYSAAIELCNRSAMMEEGLGLFHTMLLADVKPEPAAILSVGQICVSHRKLDVARALLALVEAENLEGSKEYLQTAQGPAAAILEPPPRPRPLLLSLFPKGLLGAGAAMKPAERDRLYGAVIQTSLLARAPLEQTIALACLMHRRRVEPSLYTYSLVFEACMRASGWREAQTLLRSMLQRGHQPNALILSKALRAHIYVHDGQFRSSGASWEHIRDFVREISSLRVKLPPFAPYLVLRAGLASGVGWSSVECAEFMDVDLESSNTEAEAQLQGQGLEKRLRETYFCLAAQDPAKQPHLPELWQRWLKMAGTGDHDDGRAAASLFEQAMLSAHRSHVGGQANVPYLVFLAREHNVHLTDIALKHAVKSYQRNPQVPEVRSPASTHWKDAIRLRANPLERVYLLAFLLRHQGDQVPEAYLKGERVPSKHEHQLDAGIALDLAKSCSFNRDASTHLENLILLAARAKDFGSESMPHESNEYADASSVT